MEPNPAEALLAVAHLVRPHGIRGELSSIVFAPSIIDPRDLLLGRRLLARSPEGGIHSVEAEGLRPHQDRWLIKLAGTDTMTDAERLRLHDLCLPRAELPPLPDGWYWEADLQACRAFDTRRGELGAVEGLDTSGPQPQLLVRRPDGTVARIPWVRAYLEAVDLTQKTIRLALPDGFPGIDADL